MVGTVVWPLPSTATLTTRSLTKSETYNCPPGAHASPQGCNSPVVGTVVWVPPPAGTVTIRSLKLSAM